MVLRFTFSLVASAFFISEVFADPRRVLRRSGLRNRVHNATDALSTYDDNYTTNWAGAIISKSPGAFYDITGSFTVPVPQGATDSAAAVWVGIDGVNCPNILQTGIEMRPDGNGGGIYFAWYEWFPDPPTNLDLVISAGDIITLTVDAYTVTSGAILIDNVSQGSTVHQDVSSPNALCLQDAEWIVEDPLEGSNPVPFANFGTIQFTDTVASGPSGASTPDEAETYVIVVPGSNIPITSVAVDEFSVTVLYIGG